MATMKAHAMDPKMETRKVQKKALSKALMKVYLKAAMMENQKFSKMAQGISMTMVSLKETTKGH